MSFFPGSANWGAQNHSGNHPAQQPIPGGYDQPQYQSQDYGNYGPPQQSHSPQPGYGYQGGYNQAPSQYGGGYGGYPPHQQSFSPAPPYGGGYGGYPPQQQPSAPAPPYGGEYGGGYEGYPPQQQPPLQPNHGQHSNMPPPPSTAPQQFGHGAPSNYAFQYSNCTGRRKALLIGINYTGQPGKLLGCVPDVKRISSFLAKHQHYAREDMVCLIDDPKDPTGNPQSPSYDPEKFKLSQPKRKNILTAMHWLVEDARPNDSLFFHYSGHGGQTPDRDGDEDDGCDEVIYPVDFRRYGHIVDDEMHRIMVKSLPAGCRLTAIFDSCHSGSALDLPYVYSTSGVLKEPNLAKEAGAGLISLVSSYARGDVGGMAKTAMGFFKKATTGEATYQRAKQTKTAPADVIMLSGSKDEQTSQDARIEGEPSGAMSWAFIEAVKKHPSQSYVQLLNNIRDELAGKYTQKPQLSCSHPLDTNLRFVM